MTIRKGTITFTFMFDDNLTSVDEVNAMSASNIIYECMDGDMLGRPEDSDFNIVEVPADQVVAEELKLGCDGTFFADPDAEEDEEEEERPDRDCDPDCSRRVIPAAECDCSRSK